MNNMCFWFQFYFKTAEGAIYFSNRLHGCATNMYWLLVPRISCHMLQGFREQTSRNEVQIHR